MATNTIRTYIVIRNDTIENWNSSNSILKKGELALSLENGSFSLKAGDGIHRWSELPFIAVHSTDISDLESAIANSNSLSQVEEKISQLTTQVEEATIGSITEEEKSKIESFTSEDVVEWKEGYDELQKIKREVTEIKTENPLVDTSTVGQVVNVLNSVMGVFKLIEGS